MRAQPAEVLTSIKKRLDKIEREQGLSEVDMHRALREARAIAADIPDRDVAEAYVLGRWRRFGEVERQSDRLLAKWGRSHAILTQAAGCYSRGLCYGKALSAITEAGQIEPGNVSTYRNIVHLSMVAGAPLSAYAAKQHLLKIGIPASEVDFKEIEMEVAWMKEHDVTDEQLSAYYQAHVEVVKEYFDGRYDLNFATRTDVMDVDGEDVFCLDVSANVDGKTAARIQWDMAGRDFSQFPEGLRERVHIGVKPWN